ncbi:lysozyme [Pantoea sp. EA-12]|uniref:lysozyme n=1 Tax=Pantoea sp. EA-12 TaxID=3043303 RepID=UPI0024B5861F|nr:lysozyme [Pantoea sp. EA-12]MDI9222126.1 lysozyme [Pantoea sp. EA-12]
MALSSALRKRLLAVAGAGAFTIAATLLGGSDGLEGRRYTPYLDVAGVLTVCDGHTGADVIRDKSYTDSECDSLLRIDLQQVKNSVDALVNVPLNDYQRAALYSFAYNTGTRAFASSKLLLKLNAGDINGAREELRRWIYAKGVRRKGLINRRQIERWLFEVKNKDDLR